MKINTIFLLTGLFLIAIKAASQTPRILWSHKYGGSSIAERFKSITQLKNGSIICAGYTKSNDGQVSGNHGANDLLVQCVSESGVSIWNKLIGGTDDDGAAYNGNGEFVSASDDGGFFLAGATNSIDGDIGMTKGDFDVFIAKMDENGKILWKKTFGGDKTEYVGGVLATEDGGCLIASTTLSDNNGDVSKNHFAGKYDVWLIKLDQFGNLQWDKLYGGTGFETVTSIQKTSDGGYYFAAHTTSPDGDLTGTINHGGTTDVWVARIDSAGKLLSSKKYGGSGNDDNPSLLVNKDGSCYLAFETTSTDGDIVTSYGSYDLAVLRLASDGSVIWSQTLGGEGWDILGNLVASPDGNLILSGSTYSALINNYYQHDLSAILNGLFVKLNRTNGAIMWLNFLTGNGKTYCWAGYASSKNEIYMAGESEAATGDFNGTWGDDPFLLKISAYSAVKGKIFLDFNNNKKKDSNEPFVNNALVITKKINGPTSSSFSVDGSFENEVDTGQFSTLVHLFNPSYYKVSPDSFSSKFSDYSRIDSVNFALVPQIGKTDLRTIAFMQGLVRPGSIVPVIIIGYNVGTDTITNGSIQFIKDPRLQFYKTIPTAYDQSDDTVRWNFNQLKPLDTLVFKAYVQIPKNDHNLFHRYDKLTQTSIILPINQDLNPRDNVFHFRTEVIVPIDPNDKIESHAGRMSLSDINAGDYLNYTIHFQNVGTDTAFQVLIKDSLDSKVDPLTFEILASSNPLEVSLQNNICTFSFNHINLPDSAVNADGSQGYISYRIHCKKGIKISDSVHNIASIFFDTNGSIQTNDASTLIVDSDSLILTKFSSLTGVYNNPIAKLSWSTQDESNTRLFILEKMDNSKKWTEVGDVQPNGVPGNYTFNDTTNFSSQLYRLKVVDADGSFTYSNTVLLTVTAVVSPVQSDTVIIYPNPTQRIIVIDTKNYFGLYPYSISIIDNSGNFRIIKKQIRSATPFVLDVSALNAGVYYIKLAGANKQLINKIVIIP